MTRFTAFVLMGFLVIGIVGCQKKSETSNVEEEVSKPIVASTNYPLHYFSQRIGDLAVISKLPIPAGIDPAFFNPEAKDLEEFQEADIIFLNGAGYESWVEKVSLAERKFVNTSDSFSDQYIKEEGAVTHSHGPEGEHAHDVLAFTTWLDIENAKMQASAVYSSLSGLTPGSESSMTANYEQLVADLDALQGSLKKALDPFIGATVFASHPVYQYLGSGYGLTIKNEHWEPGQDISDHDLEHFIEKVASTDLKLMLWEGEPSKATRGKLESAGFQIVIYRPCGNVPESGDFIEEMRANIENLKRGLENIDLNR
jgi:zinc transport system substrate-binding protein